MKKTYIMIAIGIAIILIVFFIGLWFLFVKPNSNPIEENINLVAKEETNNTSNIENILPTSTPPLQLETSATRGIPILMYHFFYNEKLSEKGKDNNWTEISAFEEQMKYLSDQQYYFPSWAELEDFIDKKIELPVKSVIITIDDGDETFLRLAIPIIEKYNVKVTSFLVTSWNGDWVVPKYKSEHLDFESHSHDMHKAGKDGKGRFLSLDYDTALQDVITSKYTIGNATVFCYPFGHYNNFTKKVLKNAGYHLAFTTKNGRVYPGSDKFCLPRIRMSKGDSLSTFKSRIK